MIAEAALRAGFGLDFEHCDPEIFEAVLEIQEEQHRREVREQLARDLKTKRGRG